MVAEDGGLRLRVRKILWEDGVRLKILFFPFLDFVCFIVNF
jgi:hypothetical protein